MSGMPSGQPGALASVSVRYWAGARAAAGVERESLEVPLGPGGPTVAAVAEAALARHPDLVVVLRVASFLVGGRAARPSDPVPPDAVVEVLPPFAGG